MNIKRRITLDELSIEEQQELLKIAWEHYKDETPESDWDLATDDDVISWWLDKIRNNEDYE